MVGYFENTLWEDEMISVTCVCMYLKQENNQTQVPVRNVKKNKIKLQLLTSTEPVQAH